MPKTMEMKMANEITISARGNDRKLSLAFIRSTNKAYAKMSTMLHQAACLAFFRAAQYGDVDSLNEMYRGMRVNDQSALRVWVAEHASFVDLENGEVRHWIKFSKDAFAIVKGREEHRKDMFTLENEEGEKQPLLSLKPFYDKDVKSKDALTLDVLIKTLAKSAKSVKDKSEKENIKLPADILSLVKSIENTTTKELEALSRVSK